jgi:hypothetical protein
MIAFDDLRALATRLLALERRLEEVHMQARWRVETCHHARRLDPIEAPIANEPPDHGAVLLFHESLVVLLVARDGVTSIFCAGHHGTRRRS